jgi:hypothetical protein
MMLIGENGGCLREAVLPAVGRQRTTINLDFEMLGSSAMIATPITASA